MNCANVDGLMIASTTNSTGESYILDERSIYQLLNRLYKFVRKIYLDFTVCISDLYLVRTSCCIRDWYLHHQQVYHNSHQ